MRVSAENGFVPRRAGIAIGGMTIGNTILHPGYGRSGTCTVLRKFGGRGKSTRMNILGNGSVLNIVLGVAACGCFGGTPLRASTARVLRRPG